MIHDRRRAGVSRRRGGRAWPLRRSSQCGSCVSRAWPRWRPTTASACGPTAEIRPRRSGRSGGVEGIGQVVGLAQVLDGVVDRPPSVGLGHLDGLATGIGHPPLRLQGGDALSVPPRPAALGLAGRHELQTPLVVEDVHRRVDPAEADGLLDEVLIGDRVPSACLPPRRHPHATGGVVAGRQPGSPGRQVCRVVNGEVERPARRVIRCRCRDPRHGVRRQCRPRRTAAGADWPCTAVLTNYGSHRTIRAGRYRPAPSAVAGADSDRHQRPPTFPMPRCLHHRRV
jgi:hypothetical protein